MPRDVYVCGLGLGIVVLALVFLTIELAMETVPILKRIVMPTSVANLHRVCLVLLLAGILLLLMVSASWLGFVGG